MVGEGGSHALTMPPTPTPKSVQSKNTIGCFGGGAEVRQQLREERTRAAARQLLLAAQPEGRANSLVGTEEYLAPEVIADEGGSA